MQCIVTFRSSVLHYYDPCLTPDYSIAFRPNTILCALALALALHVTPSGDVVTPYFGTLLVTYGVGYNVGSWCAYALPKENIQLFVCHP
jgi:hypothetical protein